MGVDLMTKQELAESMAEFLGYVAGGACESLQEFFYHELNIQGWDGDMSDIELIFSPDGFFAVWDKLPVCNVDFYSSGGDRKGCLLELEGEELGGYGPDRYSAFYYAVHEMRKK